KGDEPCGAHNAPTPSAYRSRLSPSLPPEVLEPVRRQRRVNRGASDRPMPEPTLDRPGVVPLVGEGVAAGVPQYMRVRLQLQARAGRGALDHCKGGTSHPGNRASTRATCIARHWPIPRGVRMARLLSALAMPFLLVIPAARSSAMTGAKSAAICLA